MKLQSLSESFKMSQLRALGVVRKKGNSIPLGQAIESPPEGMMKEKQ